MLRAFVSGALACALVSLIDAWVFHATGHRLTDLHARAIYALWFATGMLAIAIFKVLEARKRESSFTDMQSLEKSLGGKRRG